ncbi:hypothetical protein E4U53_003352 [Claviceps sorghi]|nr:hypothetical protein E4U53_003352 [Claviceps sorghi]
MAVPSTGGSTREREWVDSVRMLIKETEDAFQAVRDVLELSAKDGVLSKTSKANDTSKARPADLARAEMVPPASASERASGVVKPSSGRLAVPERASSPLEKPLPPHPEGKEGEEKTEKTGTTGTTGTTEKKEKEEKEEGEGDEEEKGDVKTEQARKTGMENTNEQRRQPPPRRRVKKTRNESPSKASSVLRGLARIRPPHYWVDQILTGAGLKRIEADEMITREQIRQFCEGRRLRAEHLECASQPDEGRQSSDSAGSETSGTSRASTSTSTAASSNDAPSCSAAVPLMMDPLDRAVVRRDFSVPQQGSRRRDGVVMLGETQQPGKQGAAHPDPPPRNPERGNKRSHRLPTIPETEPDPADGRGGDERATGPLGAAAHASKAASSRATRGATAAPWQDDEHGHGHDANAALYGQDGQDGQDDQDDDGTAEDMADWFQTFGFESHGQLIRVDDDADADADADVVPAASTLPPAAADARGKPTTAGPASTEATLPFSAPIRFLTAQGPPRVWTSSGQAPVVYGLRESARWKAEAARTMHV